MSDDEDEEVTYCHELEGFPSTIIRSVYHPELEFEFLRGYVPAGYEAGVVALCGRHWSNGDRAPYSERTVRFTKAVLSLYRLTASSRSGSLDVELPPSEAKRLFGMFANQIIREFRCDVELVR